MDKKYKYRNEIKYLATEEQIEILRYRVQEILDLDSHTKDNGIYTIRSLYFDDYFNSCMKANENGTDPREKFRMRIYNGMDKNIKLELKGKRNGKTYKESCPLTKEQCISLMHNSIPKEYEQFPQLLQKLILKMKVTLMEPKIIIEYQRMPYIYELGNVRITFDMNVSSSNKVTSFLEKDIQCRPIMKPGYHIVEVKYDEFIPDYIYKALQIEGLQYTAFSKYYYGRLYNKY